MTANQALNRPHVTVVLAMSADGKIADAQHNPARFSSSNDKAHLEKQVALADGVLFGAGTLRAYGTTLGVSNEQLLKQRYHLGKPPQPVQIVCSRKAEIDPQLRFFQQSIPRWLLTTSVGARRWEGQLGFERVLAIEKIQEAIKQSEVRSLESNVNRLDGVKQKTTDSGLFIDWQAAFQQLVELGVSQLAVLGGGELVASLLVEGLIDEIWLTVCPLILGGTAAPTPVAGVGFLSQLAPRLELLSVEAIAQEVFLHYRL